MKLSFYEEKLLNYIGEVVIVYDGNHKKIWEHPLPDSFVKGEHTPGLRVWVSLGKDKGPYGGDYTFIMTSDGDAPEGLYEKSEEINNEQTVSDVISCILFNICEDHGCWGQVAFYKPYLQIVEKIARASQRGEGKVFVHFSPDCAIRAEGGGIEYDT